MSLLDFKTLVETVYYIAAAIAALGAFYVYYRNSRLERTRWGASLFEKFYENVKIQRSP